MKRLKFLSLVLLCTLLLGFSSCEKTNADHLRAMRGDWKGVKNCPASTPFEENGHYRVATYRKTYWETVQAEIYQVSEQDGNLFIEVGLSVLLIYDEESDRILLSSGGEYKRSKQPIKK